MTKILLINGPNLNLLGTREPQIYGYTTLTDVETSCLTKATAAGHSLQSFQSNHEGAIINRIHTARDEKVDFIVINLGAYTHTSVAIRDAILGVSIPFIEVHVTNIHTREPFRAHSYFSDKAVEIVAGLGTYGYNAAVGYVIKKAKEAAAKKA